MDVANVGGVVDASELNEAELSFFALFRSEEIVVGRSATTPSSLWPTPVLDFI